MNSSEHSSSSKLKIGLAVALFATAGGVWYWFDSTERESRREADNAVAGQVYVVKCEACGKTFEMPASDYLADLEPVGVTCALCGQRKAVRTRNADEFDRDDFKAEAEKFTSTNDIRLAVEAADAEVEKLNAQIAAAEASGDTGAIPDLRKERNRMNARIQALNYRWSELQSGTP